MIIPSPLAECRGRMELCVNERGDYGCGSSPWCDIQCITVCGMVWIHLDNKCKHDLGAEGCPRERVRKQATRMYLRGVRRPRQLEPSASPDPCFARPRPIVPFFPPVRSFRVFRAPESCFWLLWTGWPISLDRIASHRIARFSEEGARKEGRAKHHRLAEESNPREENSQEQMRTEPKLHIQGLHGSFHYRTTKGTVRHTNTGVLITMHGVLWGCVMGGERDHSSVATEHDPEPKCPPHGCEPNERC